MKSSFCRPFAVILCLLTAFLFLNACDSGGGGGDDNATVVGASGGEVEPSEGADLSPETKLVVPSNALSDEVPIELKIYGRSTVAFSETINQPAVKAVMSAGMENGNAYEMHPVYSPAAILSSATHVGLEFELSPDGTSFSKPARLEIPLSDISLESGDQPIAIVESKNDETSVILDASIANGTLTLPLTHFTSVSPLRIIKNTAAYIFISYWDFPEAEINHAVDLVKPFVSEVNQKILDAHCARSDLDPFINTGVLPSYYDLLNNLARNEGDIGADTLALHNQLKNYIEKVRLEGRPALSMADIYNKSLELTNGDAFTALVLAHEVLRSDRYPKDFKDLIEDVRGDGSNDEVGARYHLLGTAIYGFWYAYIQDHNDASKLVLDPDFVSMMEEAFVSGDIYSDPGEYVVDVAGAKLGRDLYRATSAWQDGAQGPCDGDDDGNGNGDADGNGDGDGDDNDDDDGFQTSIVVFGIQNLGEALINQPSASQIQNADIQLSGDPERPTISWNFSGAIIVQVQGGETSEGMGLFKYGIQGIEEETATGQTRLANISSPVKYGDYTISRTEPIDGFQVPSPDLEADIMGSYSIFVITEYESASITFRLTSN